MSSHVVESTRLSRTDRCKLQPKQHYMGSALAPASRARAQRRRFFWAFPPEVPFHTLMLSSILLRQSRVHDDCFDNLW